MNTPLSIDVDPRYNRRVIPISQPQSIPEHWQGTPIESLIRAENFKQPITPASRPQLLIAGCIEFRYALPIPSMYAYVIRRASGRLIGSEFSVAYILSQGVKHIALIGHNDCGMTKTAAAAPGMIEALVEQGWDRNRAEEYINYQIGRYSIEDEIDALEREYDRLKRLFRQVQIAPLFVNLADTKLFIPKWYLDKLKQEPLPDTVKDEELLSLF
jgi:carbonic anhydrase